MTMSTSELKILHSHLHSSKHYLEFGSGASTKAAAKAENILSIDSVESSQTYIEEQLKPDAAIAQALLNKKLRFHIIDIGETIRWGYPKDDSKKHLWPNYSKSVFSEKKNYDLVLVDGRFRVACILNCLLNTPEKCTIIVHDFWNRPQYHVALEYLETKERADTLGVFVKKPRINQEDVQAMIEAFQYLPGDKTSIFRQT